VRFCKYGRAIALLGILSSCGCSGPSPTKLDLLGNDSSPHASPDGRYAVYLHESGGASDPRPTGVYRVQLDSLVVRNVTTGEFAGLDWLPGTDSLVVAGRATLKVLSSVSGSGSMKWNVEPFPGEDSAQMRPPPCSMTRLQIASPTPVPAYSWPCRR